MCGRRGTWSFCGRTGTAVKRGYAFERAHDSDGDGVYDNSEGTGWVEQWVAGQPHQELYLAALDESSSACHEFEMAEWMKDDALAGEGGRMMRSTLRGW